MHQFSISRICEIDDTYDKFSELPLFGFVIHNEVMFTSVMSR